MTWASAKQDAERMIGALVADIGEARVPGLTVNLSLYTSQDTLDIMQPDNTWPISHHQQVVRAAARLLIRRYKCSVSLVTVTLADYQQWLGERQNDAQARAEYLARRRSHE